MDHEEIKHEIKNMIAFSLVAMKLKSGASLNQDEQDLFVGITMDEVVHRLAEAEAPLILLSKLMNEGRLTLTDEFKNDLGLINQHVLMLADTLAKVSESWNAAIEQRITKEGG